MRHSQSKRKPIFIIIFFVLLAIGVSVLMFRDIPAPVTEHVIELDANNVLKK